jgi:hypothetical protein
MLQPEYVHSVELGYRIQRDQISMTPGIYYRNRYNGFTSVTIPLNDSTLLTTQQNLSTDRSGGVELVVTGDVGTAVSLNLSGNGFYEEIDASNLGYEGKKSTVSWNGSLNCNVHVTAGTMIQLNSNYRSARLTPQGTTQANFILNLGGRQDLVKDKLSLTATISDVLGTMSRKTNLQTAWLTEDLAFTRDSRVVFLGLTYRFGTEPKKPKEKSLQYDESG